MAKFTPTNTDKDVNQVQHRGTFDNLVRGIPDGFDNRQNFGRQLAENIADNYSNILTARPSAKYVSGARCVLKINDKIVGFAFSVSWNIKTAYQEIREIDNILPVELAPTLISVTGSLSTLRLPMRGAGVEGWQPNMLAFLDSKYITLEVRDSETDTLLFYSSKVAITNRSETINIDDLASVQLQWTAIGFMDEQTPHETKLDTLNKWEKLYKTV